MIELAPAGSIRTEARPDVIELRLAGEIDAALRTEASESMGIALTAGTPVVVDATEVTFIDSTGIAFVMQLHHAGTESGIDVALRDPRRVLRDVLEVIGYSGQVRDADAAVA